MNQTSCSILSVSAPFKAREVFQPPYYVYYPDAYSIMERFARDKWYNRLLIRILGDKYDKFRL
jgi:hypothetical protein